MAIRSSRFMFPALVGFIDIDGTNAYELLIGQLSSYRNKLVTGSSAAGPKAVILSYSESSDWNCGCLMITFPNHLSPKDYN